MSLPNPIVLLDARARYVHPAFKMTRASTKTVFDSAGRLVTVPANALGWDHDPATGQARGYLAEPSATNLLLYSNDLTQGAWGTANASVSGNATTGPDGEGMAKLVEDSSSGTHYCVQNFAVSGTGPAVVSVIARASERSIVGIRVSDASNITTDVYLAVNLDGGELTLGGSQTPIAHGAEYLGNGLYRCWISFDLSVTNYTLRIYLVSNSDGRNYQGDGTSGLYVGYCQAQEGSYPTSYIETGASTVTRAGDGLFLRNLEQQGWWRSSQGTILLSASGVMPYSGIRRYFIINGNLGVRLAGPSNNLIGMVGGTLDSTVTLASPAAGSRHIIATSWGGGEAAISVNGGSVNTAQMIAEPTASADLGVGSSYNNNTGNLGGHISRAVYYPQRISNADLQSLTAIQE